MSVKREPKLCCIERSYVVGILIILLLYSEINQYKIKNQKY